MKDLYSFSDYKEFVRRWVEGQPNRGRGVYQKMAIEVRMHRTSISQVFSGDKNLTVEQGSLLCDFLGLRETSASYFLTLLEYARAGTPNLRSRKKKQIEKMRAQAGAVVAPLQSQSEKMKQNLFYSNWRNTAVSVLGTIPRFNSPDAIASHLNLSRDQTVETLHFLEELGICRIAPSGTIIPTERSTHLPSMSEFIDSHRTQWRLRAIERFPKITKDEIAFSAPVSLSEEDFLDFKKNLRSLIDQFYARIERSEPETAAIFNIDWLRL